MGAEQMIIAIAIQLSALAVVMICFYAILKFIHVKRLCKKCRSLDDISSRETSEHQQWPGRTSMTTAGAIAILNVETLDVIAPRQREPRHLPHPPPDYPSPKRPDVYELPSHVKGMQSPNILTCIICQDSMCNCCLDCGHLLCDVCALEVQKQDSLCPVCREKFTDIWRIFPCNSFTVDWMMGTNPQQMPICDTGMCRGLECDSCLSCGHILCYVCACRLEEMGSKCRVCHIPFTDIRRIYF